MTQQGGVLSKGLDWKCSEIDATLGSRWDQEEPGSPSLTLQLLQFPGLAFLLLSVVQQ